MEKNEKNAIIIVILFSAFIFFLGLGAMPLTDPDETFYAETAKEMLKRGEFLTPCIFGKPQFEKPPLYYWLVIFSFKLFGVNEFSARIPSAVFGVLGVFIIYLLGRILINKRAAFLSAIIMATSVNYLALSRACVTDMVLAVFILAAFTSFFYGYFSRHYRNIWYILSAACLALAVLTKGPIGIFLPFLILGIYLLLVKELKRIKELPIFRCALLFFIIAAPWYFVMYKVHGKEFIDVFFGFHNIMRYLEPEHTLGDVGYYYFPVLLGGFLPWTIFLLLGVWQVFREREEKIKKSDLFLIIWFLAIFIFFSFSRTKLPTYIFPLYPAISLVAGRFLDVYITGNATKNMRRITTTFLILFLISLIVGIIVLFFVAKRKYPTAANIALISGALFTLLLSFCVAAFLKNKFRASLSIFMLSLIVISFPIQFIVFPEIGLYESSKKISEELLKFAKPSDPIGAETRYIRGVAFYTDREDVIDVHPHGVIVKFLPKEKRVFCIIKEKNHIQLYARPKKAYEKPTYVIYKLGNKVLITNKVPPDGKFLKKRTKSEPY